jgi:hypothetical protein
VVGVISEKSCAPPFGHADLVAIDEVRALSLVRPAKNLPASLNGATVVAVEEHSIGKRELPPF